MGIEVYTSVTPPDLFVDPAFTLAANVTWITPGDAHWQGGVQYEANCSEVAATLMECISGAPSPIPAKASTYSRLFRGARAFTAYAEVDCSPTKEWWTEGQTRVLRALAMSGPTQLERTFWTGVAITGNALVYPNLTSTGPIFNSTGRVLLQPSATVISGAPLDVVEGMGRLEKALGDCYDGVGWIHVPSNLIQALYARNQCYERNGKLYSSRGNIVVVGDGYSSNVGPGNTTPPGGSGWLAATSPVWGIRGTPRTWNATQSFDRNVDTYKVMAEQTFLLAWECCLVNVLVTTGGEQAGEPGAATQDT